MYLTKLIFIKALKRVEIMIFKILPYQKTR